MVKGKKKILLSKEEILKRVSTYDIYRFYHGNFKVNEVSVNRHRGEKNPSLIIGNKLTNELTHKDFGDYRWRGDAFHFVEQIHNCDYYTALSIIDRDMNLGISSTPIKGRKVVTWEQPEEITKKPPFFQIVTLKKFTKEGLDYWERYSQGEEDLKRENIYMAKEIWRNRRKIYMGNLLTFCYYYPDIDCWKIYRPFAPIREKDTPIHMWKWDNGGVPFNYCDGINDIQNCKYGYLTKSKKDKMVIRRALGTNCVADVQAEDPSCISVETVNIFKENSENRIVIFDSDKKGKESSRWLTDNYGFKHCNVPDMYLQEGINDFAELALKYGIHKVTEHFKKKGYI